MDCETTRDVVLSKENNEQTEMIKLHEAYLLRYSYQLTPQAPGTSVNL